MNFTEELKRRKELAKAATPGPWDVSTVPTSIGQCHKVEPAGVCIYDDHRRGNGTERGNNAAFIASLNPTVALALIECAEALTSIGSVSKPEHDKKEFWIEIAHARCADTLATDTQIARLALSRLAKAMGCES